MLFRVRLGRNISKFSLCPGITNEQRNEVEKLLKTAFTKLEGDLAGKYYTISDMDTELCQQMVENNFIFLYDDPHLSAAGMEGDWPNGRGVFHNEKKTLLAWINEEDHLRMIAMESGKVIYDT